MALRAHGLAVGTLKGCHSYRLMLHAGLKSRNGRRNLVTAAAVGSMQATADAYNKLRGRKVVRSSDFAEVDIPSLWGHNEKAVVAFTRELAIQLRRDVKPSLDAAGLKLFLVSIGTKERSVEFAEVTGFPRDYLLADPTSTTYEALGLVKGVRQTFFGSQTAFSFLKRIRKPKGLSDLKDILSRWKPWIPPKQDQAFQQGGMFVFDGSQCVWSHYDQATGDHADLSEVLGVATDLAQLAAATAEDCGCPQD